MMRPWQALGLQTQVLGARSVQTGSLSNCPILWCNQITDSKEDHSIPTPAAGGRIDDNGQLLCRIDRRERAIFHRREAEPCLSTWTELQLVYEGPASQFAVCRVSRPVAGVMGDDLVDPHLDATWTTQVVSKPTSFSQSARQRRKHQTNQYPDDCHHAKKFD